jgi:hypothetical protein
MSITLIDVFTYALVEVSKRSPSTGVVYFWILSIVLLLMVAVDLVMIIVKGSKSKFDSNPQLVSVQHPYTELAKHFADKKTYTKGYAKFTNFLVVIKYILLSLTIVVA